MSDVQQCKCGSELSEEDMLKQIDGILDDYKGVNGALIPVLQIAQKMFGYLPKSVLKRIGVVLNKPYSEVAGVVSFYSFFSTVPRGKYLVRVCLGTACYVRGGKEVLDALKRELKIDVGQTTHDKLFSLDVGRCFGACGLAPVIMVNDDVHQRVKKLKVGELLDVYRKKNEGTEKEAN
jgi:NADH:ubiquinone oxidoreductase subunit E